MADFNREDRYAWAGWAVLFVVTSVVVAVDGNRSVVPNYHLAALDWFAGRNLYDGTGVGGFTYFPHAAILFAPFAVFPPVVGEILWRLVNIGVFAAGILGLARLAGERSGRNLFPLMSLIAVPLAWDCARNGQSTLIMTGLMLLTVVDLARCRFRKATLWLTLSVAVKPLAIVLVLLVTAIDRTMTRRVVVGMLALALFPFLTQHPVYVIQQYADCFLNTKTAAHVGVVVHGWTTPFTALRVAGLDVPEKIQTLIRLAAAGATLSLCFFTRRRHDPVRSAVYVFSLAAIYLLLFSPRTENNTYAMLAPAIGIFIAGASIEKRKRDGILLSGIVLALLISRPVQRLIAPDAERIWLAPLLGSCFALYLLIRLFNEPADKIQAVGHKCDPCCG